MKIWDKPLNFDVDRRYYLCDKCFKIWDMGTALDVKIKKKIGFKYCSYCGKKINYKKVKRIINDLDCPIDRIYLDGKRLVKHPKSIITADGFRELIKSYGGKNGKNA